MVGMRVAVALGSRLRGNDRRGRGNDRRGRGKDEGRGNDEGRANGERGRPGVGVVGDLG